MRKWNLTGLLLTALIVLLASCELAIPEALTIKGHPGLYLDLGSPFKSGENSLVDLLRGDKIKEMMSNGDPSLKIAELDDDPLVQTYAALFPIEDRDITGPGDIPGEFIPGDLKKKIEGEFNPDLSSLTDFGMKFEKVEGFIYTTGLGDSATLTFNGVSYGPNIPDESVPAFPDVGDPPLASLGSYSIGPIDLTDSFNSGEPVTLNYEFEFVIAEVLSNPHISMNMIIKLPLKFKISDPPSVNMPAGKNKNDYVKLDMKNLMPAPGAEAGDLFGRRPGDEDNILKNLESLKFILNRFTNNILPDDPDDTLLVIDGGSGSAAWGFDFDPDSAKEVLIDPNDLPNPFNPKFEILLKKNAGADPIFSITPKEEKKLDFNIAVEAMADLDYKIKFGE
ncbi:hypothetical protein FACS1894110_18590 [Spirochaetia bacterium]|nr:hypothetical protein FACS1894110_18590 [Spirochaetia bacterium]